MKKLLLALALCLAPSAGWAQCNGVFPNNTVCGNVTGSPNTPRPTSPSAFSGTAAGTNGQIQYNNNGALGGFTATQDCTITPSPTGAVNCTKLQNVAVTTTGATSGEVLSYNGAGWLHNTLTSILNTFCAASPTTCGAFFGYLNVVWYGAVDDCATDATTAFQNAITAADAAGGTGQVFIPPVRSSGCFLVGGINATGITDVTIFGSGDASLVKVHGSSSTNHNWFDLSIASNVTFDRFKVGYDGSTVPSTLFFMGSTAGARPTGIRFNRLNIAAHTTQALVFAFGNAPNNNQNVGFSCQDSTWVQLHNGSSTTNAPARNTTIALDGSNIKGLASDFVTFTTGPIGILGISLSNCMFVDLPSGFGNGSRDNNSGGLMNVAGEVIMIGGGFRCVCFSDLLLWGTNSAGASTGSVEDAEFIGVDWENADGSNNTVEQLILSQGATNGNITFRSPFWSEPLQSMLVLGDACGANCGGISGLRIELADINNVNSATLIGDTNCTGFTTTNPWIAHAYIEAGGWNILSCGVITADTSIINKGTITSAGAVNSRNQP